MRPFKSVAQALDFYFRQALARRAASGAGFQPRVQGLDGRGRRDDLTAVFLSVELCLDILKEEERLGLAQRFLDPGKLPGKGDDPEAGRVYHRAMVKLGREMRRRGVVG